MRFARLTEYSPKVDGMEVRNKIILVNPANVNVLSKEGTDFVRITLHASGYVCVVGDLDHVQTVLENALNGVPEHG